MLRITSKYRIGKRLGVGIFEQLQTQKFALSDARSKKTKKGGRGGSDFGRQLLEKQRVRFTYGLGERQLANYAATAFTAKDPSKALHGALEGRLDSIVYRAGFCPTRRAARQAVSHGNFTVNGRRVTIPSLGIKKGDVVEVRGSNRTSALFAKLTDEATEKKTPAPWLAVDFALMKADVSGTPGVAQGEQMMDYPTVFEFYSR